MLPDWLEGLNSRACEWVENRDWMFSAPLPDDMFVERASGTTYQLNFGGLDGNGVIVFNKKQIATFDNAYIPLSVDITEHLLEAGNRLHIIFFVSPRWLGQVGYTSQMKDWKPRFNYGWDWMQRIVQVGAWEPVMLSVTPRAAISGLRLRSRVEEDLRTGHVWIKANATNECGETLRIDIEGPEGEAGTWDVPAEKLREGHEMSLANVQLWWPNGSGAQPLYSVTVTLIGKGGATLDVQSLRTGFKRIEWKPCQGAVPEADPWICVVNGKPIFLQGINWTPISATFADIADGDYDKLIGLYKTMGANIFRVWGGAFLERAHFFDLCDRHGILIWQEFPLSSSGHENWPHEDEPSMQVLVRVAQSYITRRQHHASLLMWCGGNELQGSPDGGKTGTGLPVTLNHPLMQRWQALVAQEDPGRRFVPSSSSGPRFMAFPESFGKGLHWDVHGPWRAAGDTDAATDDYWRNDDSLFRSELGAPGASSAAIIRRYSGGLPVTPGTMENPVWRRFSWWLEWDTFIREAGRQPLDLEDFVQWSQQRQARLLRQAVGRCKERFPAIGGCILWMGHDSFPCATNTSIIDFHGELKPAGEAVAEVWRS